MHFQLRLSLSFVFGAMALALMAPSASATPVRAISGLESITFWERTGGPGPTPSTFAIDGPELTTRLADPLGAGNNDIAGATSEYYDVFYSDADGFFNLDGEYLSIEGVFLQALPAGGGLNLAEIELDFGADPGEFGNFVASFVALGDNAFPDNVGRAIDGDLQTHTTMGNTLGSNDRLRVTLGFSSSSGPPGGPGPGPGPGPSSVPEPSAALLLGAGLIVIARRTRTGSR